ncbi:MAG: hypothetical protein JF627_01490 [Alphaproteobacteria bacterium]|nr:hypothetical protein [Alphaproteobacteria bacterium]
MSERNEKMAAMLAAAAPARDPGFEIAVLARIEQRRFRRSLAWNLLAAIGAALLLAFVMPALAPTVSGTLARLGANALVMVALLGSAFAAWHFRPTAEA